MSGLCILSYIVYVFQLSKKLSYLYFPLSLSLCCFLSFLFLKCSPLKKKQKNKTKNQNRNDIPTPFCLTALRQYFVLSQPVFSKLMYSTPWPPLPLPFTLLPLLNTCVCAGLCIRPCFQKWSILFIC